MLNLECTGNGKREAGESLSRVRPARRTGLPHFLRSLRTRVRLCCTGLSMLSIALVGHVPSHVLRRVVYQHVFRMRIGKRSSIHWRARFRKPSKLVIGNHCVIGECAMIDARSGVVIGDNVNIAGEVAIYTLEHDPDSPTFDVKGGPVIIEDYVYIGSRVVILPGVRIGYGAVVATGAVVTQNVAPYHIVGGVPARFIRERNRDLRYKLDFALPFQ